MALNAYKLRMRFRDCRKEYRPEQETLLIYTGDSLTECGEVMAKVASEMTGVCKARGKGAPREQVYSYSGVLYPGW